MGAGPHTVLPDGCPEIVFHHGDPFRLGGLTQERALFAGQITSPIVLEPQAKVGVVGVRFEPAGAWALLRFDQRDAAGRVAPLADLAGPLFVRRLEASENTRGLIATLESEFLRRMPPAADTLTQLAAAMRNGGLSNSAARAFFGRSERHWQRLFLERTGLAPKTMERLGRFRRAAALSASGTPWVAVAADCGYADQSHLIRDYRQFAGAPPAAASPGLFD